MQGQAFLDLVILTGGTTDQVAFTFIGGYIAAFIGALCAGNNILQIKFSFIEIAGHVHPH